MDEPPHVHVTGNEEKAKGFNQREIALILEVVEENRNQMLEAWYGYFG